ncbi:hypothetical protein HK097_009116 [Rhizophlyctis rosea]|uniref:START domain-containing protein n=1 Tax=Rhizophlyctis rosea TaxID=64517 RepID=A0AAD5SHW6_9FUNG|nr:hypothetical protein HK097_009116 [Rhizophlyctis rosea]
MTIPQQPYPPVWIYFLYIVIPLVVSFIFSNANVDFARLAAVAAVCVLLLHVLGVPSLATLLSTPRQPTQSHPHALSVTTGSPTHQHSVGRLGHAAPPSSPSLGSFSAPVPIAETATPIPKPPAVEEVVENDPYVHLLPELEAEFLQLADTTAQPASPTETPGFFWHTIVSHKKGNFSIDIEKRVGKDFCFRHVVQMEATPEEAFDFLSDVGKRPVWDEMCEAGGVVTRVSKRTTIQYFRTKGMWPTSPREAIVASFIRLLPDNRYLNVTQSIPSHPQHTPRPSDVRMIARIAGQVVSPDPLNRPRMCRVVQIIDGDLGGYLPKKVVAMVTTQAIPRGMAKANALLRDLKEQKDKSQAIEIAEGRIDVQGPGGSGRIAGGSSGLGVEGSSSGGLAAGPSVSRVEKGGSAEDPVRVPTTTSGAVANRATLLPVARTVNRGQILLRLLQRMQPWMILSLLLSLLYGRWRKKI